MGYYVLFEHETSNPSYCPNQPCVLSDDSQTVHKMVSSGLTRDDRLEGFANKLLQLGPTKVPLFKQACRMRWEPRNEGDANVCL